MEYRWLILNRSYVLFGAPEGIYGWMFMDSVDNSDPGYFQPFVERLKIRGVRKPSVARQLAARSGGFFISRDQILAMDYLEKKKWGLGGIPHSGILRISLTTGKNRVFIILGQTDGYEVQRLMG